MSNTDNQHKANRRSLLKGLAVAGTAATAAAAGAASVVQQDAAETTATAAPEHKKGYRVTPHVEEYYRKARF